ncbi:MAG TPA: hypothetical protein VJ803_06820 [Gemmatimonadaceae bacterium]|nr:hypothetical protein [Gemmatimonadaceae bacterium]
MSPVISGRFGHRSRAAVATLLVVSALGLAACDDDDVIAPTPLEGVYVLTSINGFPLPFTVPGTNPNVVVESGEITIAANGSYDGSVEGETGGAPEVLFADAGSTAESGMTVSFTSTTSPGLMYSGTRNGDILSFSVPATALGLSGPPTVTLTFEK